MVLFLVLGGVVIVAFIVMGVLFFMLGKEGHRDELAVPLTDINQIKNELSSKIFEQKNFIEKDSQVIPVFEAKVGLPVEPSVQVTAEDEAYRQRAQKLEDELLDISKKAAGQSDEAKEMIASLTKENEALKSQKEDLEKAQQRLKELEVESNSLSTQNVDLQSQLDVSSTRVQALETEMAAVKMQMAEEINKAKSTVEEITKEKEMLLAAPQPVAEAPAGNVQEIESLKAEVLEWKKRCQEIEDNLLKLTDKNNDLSQENEQLKAKEASDTNLGLDALNAEIAEYKQRCQEMENNLLKLNDQHGELSKENEQLKYEMVKARAQSSGLERMTFNYKNQVEDFLKQIKTAQEANGHLSEEKNSLEGLVNQIKSDNEDLAQKDQLVRFELEKNRSRIIELERDYEALKARVQQGEQQ